MPMLRRLSAIATLIFLNLSPALAADYTPPSKDPASAVSGRYDLEKSHASITFRINHMGYSYYTGRFNDFDATLLFDPKDISKSRVSATIDPTSVDVNNAHLEESLKSTKVFDVANYRAITFSSEQIEKTGPNTGKVTGLLTILTASKPVIMNVTFNGAGINPMSGKNTVGFSANGKLKRSDFGLNEWLPMVGDDVEFWIEGEFVLAKE